MKLWQKRTFWDKRLDFSSLNVGSRDNCRRSHLFTFLTLPLFISNIQNNVETNLDFVPSFKKKTADPAIGSALQIWVVARH